MRTTGTLFLLVMTLSAQPPLNRPRASENPLAGNKEAVAAGQKRFVAACSGCHGPSGEGGGRGPNLAEGRAVTRGQDSMLFRSIQKGVAGTDMPPFPLPDRQVWELVAFIRNLTAPAIETPVPGNPANGETLFYGKGGCNRCHMIRNQGGYLGPDFTDIAQTRPYRLLKEGLLAPSARIKEGYQGVTVTLLDGTQIEGVVKNNTNYTIQLMDGKGNLHLLEKQNLREVVFKKGSLMPEDYAKRFTTAEINDLLAFLSRQAVRS